MSTVVTASGLTKHIGGRTLFADLGFRVRAGDRMSLSGRNGSGKTTLLRVLAREIGHDGGSISFGKGVRVALHDQRPPRERSLSLRDYVLDGLRWVLDIEEELARLEERMATEADEATLSAYADAQARLEQAGGYRWRDGATATLHGLGFGDAELDRDLRTFSGGELTRASLARVLAARPDLLLLDEPTNHLDIGSLEWLEEYLTGLDAAVILVAHDRWFLESVGTCVLELERGKARFFAGPWHAWRAEKAARELAAGRDVERRKAEIARMERFVERFRAKATKARQAQSRVKMIEKLRAQGVDGPPGDERALSFSFAPAARSGRVVLEMEGATVKAGEKLLLSGAELWLERGEHVCLVGPNGAGKSTLVGSLTGRTSLVEGKLRQGHNVELGYLAQHAELSPEDQRSVLSYAQHETGLSEARTRGLLGRFLFSGDDVKKALGSLSGGEAQRLSLALLVNSDSNFLVLDEPTNHLDVESREALEDALLGFDGTLLLISHDRALLEAVGTRTVALQDGTLRSYSGGWSAYRDSLAEAEAAARAAQEATTNGGRVKAARGESKGPSKNRKARAERLGREVEAAEAELKKLEDELADPASWGDGRTAAKSTRRHEQAKAKLEELYAEWEEAEGS